VTVARGGGWGYAGEEWQASEVARWLRTDGARYPLFTNNAPDVWFATGRRSWKLPDTADADSAAAFGAMLRRRHGALVGFARPGALMADPAALASRLGLVVLVRLDGATVWVPASGQGP